MEVNNGKKKVTITDIAKICGVSIKTVSRVMNGGDNVSSKTRLKVEEAMRESGYQVNILARGLKGNKTNVIMVFTDRHEEEHLSAWHTVMLKYLFRYARERQLKVVMSPSNSDKFISDETDGYYLLANGLADGVILLEHAEKDLRVQYLKEQRIPFVMFGEVDDTSICSVSLDNYQVGYKGGMYLSGNGYRNIEFFVGDEKFNSNRNRAEGFINGTKNVKGRFQVKYGASTVDKAYRMATESLKQEERPDAFFVSGDERALGVYRAIYEAGCHIPDDVAVLGVDNIPMGNYLHPRISSIDQDFESMAKECVEQLLDMINGKELGRKMTTKFLPSVIEREST